MTYSEAIQFLYDLCLFGARLGLESAFKLAARAGNPQDRLRFIHVAGTNGKGSTCAMLESMYRAAGWRVGLFTSPHLVAFGERIQVDRRVIPEADVVRLVSELRGWLKDFSPEDHPTFFEVVTVLALRYFAEQRCELVIWETGLGGRLDATNIVTPLASVITNIQFDHQKWLGHTLDQIAFEKAGIIKPGVPVITAAERGHGLEVIAKVAREAASPLTVVEAADVNRPPLDTLHLPLRGEFQRTNAAVAVATARALAAQLPISDKVIAAGLSQVQWPGRLQLIRTAAGRLLLLDGAHNVPGTEALIQELQAHFSQVRPTLVFGVLSDKDWQTMGPLLAKRAGRVLLAPVKSARGLPPDALAPVFQQANPAAPVRVCASLAEALQAAADDPFVVITGSLYVIGEAMELLHLSTAPAREERSLNEWSAACR